MRHTEFTWFELWVTLAILGVLVGALVPSIQSPRDSAPRSKAAATARSIAHACDNYAHDYGAYPVISAALGGGSGSPDSAGTGFYSYGDVETAKCKVPNSELFDVLRAIPRGPNSGHVLNQRQQKYFEDGRADRRKAPQEGFADGEDFPVEVRGQLFDPWGKQYCIILDADGDGVLNLQPFFQDVTEPIRRPVAVFSMGKNKLIGGDSYPGRLRKERANEPPEDVTTFQ
jgi:type II secretory pathway pseudopilin PulG